MSQRRLYDPEIGAAIRQYVHDQLKVSLGLKSTNRGAQFSLSGTNQDGSLSARLPAIRVSLADIEGDRERGKSVWMGRYTYDIQYFRALAPTEDVEENARPALLSIANLFIKDEGWRIPTLAETPGMRLRAATLVRVGVNEGEVGELQGPTVRVGGGVITVVVEADSFPTP